MKMLNKKFQKNKKSLGFSIVELIVVITIFSVFAGVVIFKYSDFNSGVTLQNTAQEIALRIQQAQTGAISGEFPRLAPGQAGVTSDWTPSYGVYFDRTKPTEFSFFFDRTVPGLKTGNGVFDDPVFGPFSCGTGSSECVDVVTITTGETIKSICATSSSTCGAVNGSVVFRRPFPDAEIFRDIFSGSSVRENESIRVQIVNKNNTKGKEIIVTALGQIFIKDFVPSI
jgi:prepilin-type N-terminal cleavage/methylation domain-containing protein